MLKLTVFSTLLAAASACFCMNTGNVNVRSSPCGNVIGGASQGQCAPDARGRETCLIDGTSWNFCEINWADSTAWIVCSYMDSEDSSRCQSASCGGVRLISRAEWGARPPTGTTNLNLPLSKYFIHHSAGSHCYNENDCTAQVRSIQNYHMDGQGWSDIGYNFLVGEDGNAYEGRGWSTQGAHASGWNSESHGICVIGTFTSGMPNNVALNAVQGLIDCGIAEGAQVSNYDLHGHRNGVCTACPGDTFYANWVQEHSHYGGGLPGGCLKKEWGPSILYN